MPIAKSSNCNLNKIQLNQLKSLAHKLKPVVTVGQQGMKESIDTEIEYALAHHQLIKVKVNVGDRDVRDELVETFCTTHKALLIQRTGNIATLFKNNPKKANLFTPVRDL